MINFVPQMSHCPDRVIIIWDFDNSSIFKPRSYSLKGFFLGLFIVPRVSLLEKWPPIIQVDIAARDIAICPASKGF